MLGYSYDNTRKVFFTERLKNRMKQLTEYPCTLVEAPVGYGKTTMVVKAVEKLEAHVIWQKIYVRNAAEFWTGFYQVIAEIDEKCTNGLQNIRMLEDSLMRRELMLLMDSILVQRPTFIIIDDYHYVNSKEADDFLRLLIFNMPDNLHLIIITRISVFPNINAMKIKGLINHIVTKDLSLSQGDILNYFLLFGIHPEKEEVKKLYYYSEGWISALYLFAMDYKLHGCFVFTRNVSELVRETVYDPLDEERKDFLMTVCNFNSFRLDQASYVWQKGNAEELLESLMAENAFLSRDSITGNYSLHNIFTICLREKFNRLSREKKKYIWRRVGDVYFQDKLYMDAMEYYYNAGDFDGVMKSMEGAGKVRCIHYEHKEKFIEYYTACPMEAKIRYPLAILVFAMTFITQFREKYLFILACNDFHIAMNKGADLSDWEREQLLGEYEVLQSFACHNDLIKMGKCKERAYPLLKEPVRFFNIRNSSTFSSPSLLYLYYRESGKLEEMVRYLERSMPYYEQNAKGQGVSFYPIIEAERLFYMGYLEEALIAVHKGLPMARISQETDIEICGLFLLARIALYQGDYPRVTQLLSYMEGIVRNEVNYYQTYWLVYTYELCKASIYSCLEQIDQIPDWIFKYEYPKHLNFLTIAYADMIYGKALLLKERNAELLGFTMQSRRQASIYPNLLAMIYTDIYEAVADYRLNRIQESVLVLKSAMDTAMPDGIVIPFAEHMKLLGLVFDTVKKDPAYTGFINRIQEIYDRYIPSLKRIIENEFMTRRPELSKRERQISLLVMDGLNNKEIAEILFISPNTVKQELKKIFKKFNINSRVLITREMID